MPTRIIVDEVGMIGRDYFARQAATLLRLARLTHDARQAARLAVKAADLKERLDSAPPTPEVSPAPPDVSPDPATQPKRSS